MAQLNIKPRSKSLKEQSLGDIDATSPVKKIASTYAASNKLDVNRLRLTVITEVNKKSKHTPLKLDKSLAENGVAFKKDETIVIYAKDLGPQISWRTVFVLEYLGPLLVHPIFYFYYGKFGTHSTTQTLSFLLVMLHFLKREFETIFVHKFSLSTMPLFNLFKNSFHYWLLSGFNLAFFIYSPNALPENLATSGLVKKTLFYTTNHSRTVNDLLVGVWLYCEVSNFITHLNLASLRQSGSTERKIPFGYGFSFVSFPNYFFESFGWLVFALINNNPFSYLFLIVGSGQMLIWATQKHKRYLKEFGDKYPKNRKIFVPFIY